MQHLQEKLHLRFKNVRDSYNFYNVLNSDSGIQEVEFRDMIVCLGFDMTEAEYRKLWRYFDRDCDGCISYYEWNNVVGKVILPLSDITLNRPESPNRVKEWTRRAMARGLNNLLKEETNSGSSDPVGDAFREINCCRSGFISHEEFIQVRFFFGKSWGITPSPLTKPHTHFSSPHAPPPNPVAVQEA